jgi:DNA-binding response OmpR family regulator
MSEMTVLCVAPDGEQDEARARLASESGLSVVGSDSLAAAKGALHDADVDCLVTAYDLPDGTGIDLIRHVRNRAQDTGCILFTDADRATVTDGVETPLVADYLHRGSPAALDRLATLVTATARRRTQTPYPLPEAESRRLAALDRLDLEAESLRTALDRVTALTADRFDVDRAAVNVITESTQEVLAAQGADWSTIPRAESICTYAILDEGVTVIEDTAADPRFADNEALDELDIRFYAGAPLRTDAGLPIGTLCVYDATPREFDAAAREYLDLLADEAVQWLELHARLAGHERPDGTMGGP